MGSEQRQAAKKQMMVLMQEGYSRPRSRQSCRNPHQSIDCLPLVPPVRTTSERRPCMMAGVGTPPRCTRPSKRGLKADVGRRPTLPSSSLQRELNAHLGVLDGAGGLLLVAAAHETGLLVLLETAITPVRSRLPTHGCPPRAALGAVCSSRYSCSMRARLRRTRDEAKLHR